MTKCEMCPKHFERTGRQRYCSARCKQRAHRMRHSFEPYYKHCKICAAPMWISCTQQKDKEYCTQSCKQRAYRMRNEQERALVSDCQHCGEPFALLRIGTKYCSASCRGKAYRADQRYKKNLRAQ